MANMVNLDVFKQIIGEQLFQEVITKLAGMNLYIPKNKAGKYQNKVQRNEQIRFDYYTRMEIPELMAKYNLSKSRIYQIVEFKQGRCKASYFLEHC